MSSIILQNSVPGSVPSSAPATPRSTSSSLLVPGSASKGRSLYITCMLIYLRGVQSLGLDLRIFMFVGT